jgi:hypothetical protein
MALYFTERAITKNIASCHLEKFNLSSGYEEAIFEPKRLEMYQETKRSINLTIALQVSWNPLSSV